MRKGKPFTNGFLPLFAALVILLCGHTFCVPAYAVVDYAVTSPWIASIASFIGGSNVNIRCIGNWDSAGNIRSLSRPKAGEIIIALDFGEAAALKIDKNSPNLRLLYEKLALPGNRKYSAFFDPAMLPFLAQSIMKILSEADKERYTFYQRRLAEFQSRIDSTVDIGRYMLDGAQLLDLTGAQGMWVRAAVPGTVRPPDDVWESWLAEDQTALRAALAEAGKRGWLILLDNWTPPSIRNAAVAYEKRLTLSPPTMSEDSFTFLHDIFITVAAKIKTPPAPQVKPKTKK